MREFVTFAALGLGAGACYALLAQGVVLIFRGSGTLNLAHGAFAMVGAFIYEGLTFTDGWATLPAMVVAIVVVMVIGFVTDQGLMRRLRRSSALSRLVATLGVLLLLESVAVIVWGPTPRLVPPFFPARSVDVLGVTFVSDRLYILGAAVALTVALMGIWRFTRIGWITEAVSENPRGVASLGWSPEVVSAATWTFGAGVAAFAGITVSTLSGLDIDTLTLIVIAALAAAMIGRLRSFPLTLIGGLVIGMTQSVVNNYVDVPGLSDAIPFLVVVVLFMLTGSTLPLRGHVFDRLPRVGSGRIDLRVVVALAATGLLFLSLVSAQDWLAAFTATSAVAIIGLSIVVLTGYAGQLSLAQFALGGIGALTAARLMAADG